MKCCVIQTSEANLPVLVRHLPPNVKVVGRLLRADTGAAMLRLEGDGLPDWCYVPEHSDYPRAVAELLDSGELRFIPGSGLPDEQVPAKFKTPA